MSDQCRECKTWWEKCPCCQESFCPDCGALESEQDEENDDDNDDEEWGDVKNGLPSTL